jgi:oligopeptide/dipeptide ABC transporter ATP-binding protein
MDVSKPLMTARGLTKYFHGHRTTLLKSAPVVRALDGVSLDVYADETLGVVGESGCGKTTLGRIMLRLERPTAGEVRFDGEDLARLDGRQMAEFRRNATMVFQDPYSSLNPSFTIEQVLWEAYRHRGNIEAMPRREHQRWLGEILERVGLSRAVLRRYPHQLSGGQRQRVGVARALCLNPRFIVADEPVSALDVSVQAQILNLLVDLKRDLALTYLFISHDLRVVRYIADRVVVMYLGKVVELATQEDIFRGQLHPYTRALLLAVAPNQTVRQAPLPKGELPSAMSIPPGCSYHTRCPFAQEICRVERPALREVKPGHWAACHFAGQI